MKQLRCLSVSTLLVAWLALQLFAGCGDGRPTRVPVAGQVLIDGKPLTHGYVRFIPSGGRPSRGKIDAGGRFSLGCFESGDGAIIGEHCVEVSGQERKSDWEFVWHAPKKYANSQTSGLKVQIGAPTRDHIIELTWDGGAPFAEIDETAKPFSDLKSSKAGI